MSTITIVVIGAIVFMVYRAREHQKSAPRWVWYIIGAFLLYTILRNADEAIKITGHESDAWWPVIKENAQKLSDGFRKVIQSFMKGES
ncbi:hypothetical protein [Paenibacillus polymyxa]|uniref:hypothetical protein n=1 Tax=Paenibacillus polymyxa TaxID=1406 RepID=UPI0025B72E03|nr:hypothetical protein [Paenibacillus polymyxa]MDN4090900.1 hypothetical protein [Paenibacillus polymyxa]